MGSISSKGELIKNKTTNFEKDFLEKFDLVMPKDDIGNGSIIGKVALIDENKRYICGDHVYRIKPKNIKTSEFLFYLINSPQINKQIKSKANGTSQIGLGKNAVLMQDVFMPEVLKLKDITKTLNQIKQDIVVNELVLKSIKIQKQGLMQKLLTGKWRVV
jgi:type I restriction enzyme S subunit